MMRLPAFDYRLPRQIEEAVAMVRDAGEEGTFVAGGTDLYPNMKRRQQTPKVVVGLRRIPELQEIRGSAEGGLRIGAGLTLSRLLREETIRRAYPVVAEAAAMIATPLLRNMGTIGGNLLLDTRCNYYDQTYEWRKAIDFCMKKDGTTCWVAPSSPRCWAVQSSDLVPVVVALGARVRLVGPEGERVIPAADLYRDDGIRHLKKRPDELLTEILLPPVSPDGSVRATYRKLRRRGAFDFPVAGVAARLERAKDGTVTDATIVLGAVASHPVRATEAERLVTGVRLTPERIEAAAQAAFRPAKPLDNTDFEMSWRKEIVRHFVRIALGDLAR
ncbi:MAG: 4-hydroxybenzoyl-CoA reductase [Deltaproteobacteria bacterium]|nr:MAG: 4-hydroxybenzoyl-CoA reductase [Deltaproteobacteria bacterium]